MSDRAIDTAAVVPDGETAAYRELARISFVSKNLLRLQGLYIASAGVLVLALNFLIDAFGSRPPLWELRHLYANLLVAPIALGLPALVFWYYKRSIGSVYYSGAQGRAAVIPLLISIVAVVVAGLLFTVDAVLFYYGGPRPPISSILLLNLTFGLGLLAQWWVEGRKRQFLHYPLVGAINLAVSALAALGFQLETTATAYFVGRPQPFFDYFTLGTSLIVLGLCDHRLLTRHLKRLPAEPS